MSEIDWSVWGPPTLVLVLGIVVGLISALRLGSGDAASSSTRDLEARKDGLMKQLRDLDADRAKLDEADYSERKEALVREAAEVLRQLEEGVAEPAPAPSAPRSKATWIAIVFALGFIGISAVVIQQALAPRSEGGTMTGKDLSGGAPATATFDEDLAAAEAALVDNPEDIEALHYMTRYSVYTRDLNGAMKYMETCRRVAPDDPRTQVHLAALNIFIGRVDDAEALLVSLAGNSAVLTEVQIWTGILRLNQGRVEEAKVLLTRAAEGASDPLDHSFARSLLADVARPAPSAPVAAGPAQVQGTLSGDVEPGGVLFVYVRATEVRAGPPLAAQKHAEWSLPFEFALSEADLIRGGQWPEQVYIQAKVVRSGDPMVKSDDDRETPFQGPVAKGETVDLAF